MSRRTDGGPAFPAHDYIVSDLKRDGFQKLGETRGMTLRDYFAAKALYPAFSGLTRRVCEGEIGGFGWEAVARDAYAMADAMLKARE